MASVFRFRAVKRFAGIPDRIVHDGRFLKLQQTEASAKSLSSKRSAPTDKTLREEDAKQTKYIDTTMHTRPLIAPKPAPIKRKVW
jgi:hypothetical protein